MTGVKFQMARIPTCTMASATSCAKGGETVRIPICTCLLLARAAISLIS